MCAHDLQRIWLQRCAAESRTRVRESTYIIWPGKEGRKKEREKERQFKAFNLRRCVVSRYFLNIRRGAALPFPRGSKLSFIIDSPAFEIPLLLFSGNGPGRLYNERSERDDSLAHKTTPIRASETYVHTYICIPGARRLFISPRLNYWQGNLIILAVYYQFKFRAVMFRFTRHKIHGKFKANATRK